VAKKIASSVLPVLEFQMCVTHIAWCLLLEYKSSIWADQLMPDGQVLCMCYLTIITSLLHGVVRLKRESKYKKFRSNGIHTRIYKGCKTVKHYRSM
jgi:hypothetical protein